MYEIKSEITKDQVLDSINLIILFCRKDREYVKYEEMLLELEEKIK